jgi:hypothetical protein
VLTVPAIPIDAANPGDADAASQRQLCRSAVHNLADDLMTGDEPWANRWQIAFRNVQVRPANSTSENSQHHITRLRFGAGNLLNFQERLRSRAPGYQNGSFHFLASSSLSLRAFMECS